MHHADGGLEPICAACIAELPEEWETELSADEVGECWAMILLRWPGADRRDLAAVLLLTTCHPDAEIAITEPPPWQPFADVVDDYLGGGGL